MGRDEDRSLRNAPRSPQAAYVVVFVGHVDAAPPFVRSLYFVAVSALGRFSGRRLAGEAHLPRRGAAAGFSSGRLSVDGGGASLTGVKPTSRCPASCDLNGRRRGGARSSAQGSQRL